MRRLLPALLCALALACRKAASAPSAQGAAAEPGWRVYEDENLKISYPPAFRASTPNPGVVLFGADASPTSALQGQVVISPETGSKGLLLRDAAEAAVKDVQRAGGKVPGGIQRLNVAKGSCLSVNENGLLYVTLCDGPAGGRYQVSYAPPAPGSGAAPDVYESMLRSLTLKK